MFMVRHPTMVSVHQTPQHPHSTASFDPEAATGTLNMVGAGSYDFKSSLDFTCSFTVKFFDLAGSGPSKVAGCDCKIRAEMMDSDDDHWDTLRVDCPCLDGPFSTTLPEATTVSIQDTVWRAPSWPL